MSKTEQQMYNWASAPTRDNDLSAKTYWLIKNKLEEKFGNDVEIFLQGSYANSTNIKKDSDVDIVICYKKSYFYDIDNLSDTETNLFHKNTTNASYNFSDFKNDVENYLVSIYWNTVERKNKCIKIPWNWGWVDADIVPCFVYKRYETHNKISAEWIKFLSDKNETVISFPKQHKKNWEVKNQYTWWDFKSLVRIIKNCKKELVNKWIIKEDLVSSFLLECIFWNIPNNNFNLNISTKNKFNKVVELIYNDMWDKEKYNNYAEISDLFYLLRWSRKKSSPEEIKIFLKEAYDLVNN